VLILLGRIVADVSVVSATVLTDPYCPWSWAAEPQLRRLQIEFGDSLAYTFVIVGLHRQIQGPEAGALPLACLDAAAESGMPVDPRVFLRDPPSSTHPAGLAIAAVYEQRDPEPFIRRLREAIMLEGRRMDTAPALRRFGALATPEVAAACDLPGPRAPAELWRLTLEWRVKPRRAGGGELWELALP
jgi:putative protein-disulfide isomerase